MIHLPSRPLLFVVSAPSGAGKTTLCERLLGEFDNLVYSVSCTTREPREGEEDGVNYHFISRGTFEKKVASGEFLEHAVVHNNLYGTLRSEVLGGFARGENVLMDIDVQGAKQIRNHIASAKPDDPLRCGFVDIFIAPPSLETLQKRLVARGKDSEQVIARRVQHAANEMKHWMEYRFVIVNDRLDASYDALRSIFIAEQHANFSSVV
jgi:guanylate kinase